MLKPRRAVQRGRGDASRGIEFDVQRGKNVIILLTNVESGET